MIVCRDVAWIYHRQTQWYESWHFAICLSPINVFPRRFLVPSTPLFPTPTWLSSLWPGNAAGPEWLSLKPSHLHAAAAGAATAHVTASTTASRSQPVLRLQGMQRDTQCRGHLGVHRNSISLGVSTVLKSRDLRTRWLKKEKEMGIQTFQVTEGKCESLLYRFSSYQIVLLTCG